MAAVVLTQCILSVRAQGMHSNFPLRLHCKLPALQSAKVQQIFTESCVCGEHETRVINKKVAFP